MPKPNPVLETLHKAAVALLIPIQKPSTRITHYRSQERANHDHGLTEDGLATIYERALSFQAETPKRVIARQGR